MRIHMEVGSLCHGKIIFVIQDGIMCRSRCSLNGLLGLQVEIAEDGMHHLIIDHQTGLEIFGLLVHIVAIVEIVREKSHMMSFSDDNVSQSWRAVL